EFASYSEHLLDRCGMRVQAGGKQRLAGYVEGKPHELGNHVKDCLLRCESLPSLQQRRRLLRPDADKAANLLSLRRGLRHLALTLPASAFAIQQSVSQRELEDFVIAPFAIVGKVGLKYLLYVVRMAQLISRPYTAVADHIAIFHCRLQKMPERIPAKVGQAAEENQHAWSRCGLVLRERSCHRP